MANEWDAWCRRHGVDPNTPDETLLDAFLHQRAPRLKYQPEQFGDIVARARGGILDGLRAQWRDAAQCAFYHSWDAYEAAQAGANPETQRLQVKAEVYELERWLRL